MRTLPQAVTGHKIARVEARQAVSPVLPESPCSVNVFFEVKGYGRAQATGRGRTDQEAAANLKATIQATREALEGPPVETVPVTRTREERLSTLLACGLQKAVAKEDYALVERLSKAAALVLAGKVEPGERDGMLAVRSLKDGETWYEVEGTVCTCPDYKHRHVDGENNYLCKHSLAGMMFTRLAS